MGYTYRRFVFAGILGLSLALTSCLSFDKPKETFNPFLSSLSSVSPHETKTITNPFEVLSGSGLQEFFIETGYLVYNAVADAIGATEEIEVIGYPFGFNPGQAYFVASLSTPPPGCFLATDCPEKFDTIIPMNNDFLKYELTPEMASAGKFHFSIITLGVGLTSFAQSLIQTVTLGDPSGGGELDVRIAATQVVGYAPLGVLFDAKSTTGSLYTGGQSWKTFHDVQYEWDFDDQYCEAIGAKHSISGKSMCRDFGPLAGHVYEVPGVYRVRAMGHTSDGSYTSNMIEITVKDPYADFDIFCYSNNSNWQGCPANAVRKTGNSVQSLLGSLNGKSQSMHLFRKGDSFQLNGNIPFKREGMKDVIIGSYGAGPLPIFNTGSNEVASEVCEDCKLTELDIRSAGGGIVKNQGSSGSAYRFTVAHVKATGVAVCIDYAGEGNRQLTVFDVSCKDYDTSSLPNGGGWSMLQNVDQAIYIGLDVDQRPMSTPGVDTEGVIRFVNATNVVVSHSRMIGLTNGTHNVMSMRACGDCPEPTAWYYIANNDFGWGATAAIVDTKSKTGPSQATPNVMEHVFLENNYAYVTHPGGKTNTSKTLQWFFKAQTCRLCTVRNNILDASGVPADKDGDQSSVTLVSIGTPPGEASSNHVRVLNNIVYMAEENELGGKMCEDNVGQNGSANVCSNNILYMPGTASNLVRITPDPGTWPNTDGNLVVSSPQPGANPFVADLSQGSQTPGDFQIDSSSAAYGLGEEFEGSLYNFDWIRRDIFHAGIY